jgi:hypothetical protein
MEPKKDPKQEQKHRLCKCIYLVKFAQPPFRDASTHWAIFLPNESAGNDKDDIPKCGHLFHVSKDGNGCCICLLQGTHYKQNEDFALSGRHSLRSTLKLDCVGAITVDYVDKVCQKVCKGRGFNFINKNCQEWVKDVLRELVKSEKLPKEVFRKMKRHGFKTLTEHGMESSSSSVPLRRSS